MKKLSIHVFALCFCLSLLTTSCTKTCHGGGWYGNRNLSSLDIKSPIKKNISTQKSIQKETNTEEHSENLVCAK